MGGATISTSGISFQIRATDPERDAARKLLIRLRDRRVFTAFDCCDGCVRNTLASLIEVRKILVDTQVELHNLHDADLFWVVDYLRLTIRDFLSWEERLRAAAINPGNSRATSEELYVDPVYQAVYIAALDVVRAHARAALAAMAELADMTLPDGRAMPALVASSVLGLDAGES